MTETTETAGPPYVHTFAASPAGLDDYKPFTLTTGRIDVCARFRQWVETGRPPLTVDDTALCVAGVMDEGHEDADDHGWRECLKPSRYVVERSDYDASFGELGGGAEACEEHLQETVDTMIDGSSDSVEIRAVVTIRWNKGD